ncbi:MAG: bifunctional glycoside hydrolase 114/ polysaccharide deacetylase family protein [Burkholderiales bacterium]
MLGPVLAFGPAAMSSVRFRILIRSVGLAALTIARTTSLRNLAVRSSIRTILVVALALSWRLANAVGSVAFYYGEAPPWDELAAFDMVVVEPDHVQRPPSLPGNRTKVFAYVGVGEVNSSRTYLKDIPQSWRRGTNPGWGNVLVDQAERDWPAFLVERAIKPMWDNGYRGFFLDTLDSFELYAKTDADKAGQIAGMVRVIEAIKARFPAAELVLNRGFELLPAVKNHVIAVAAESIYAGWDPVEKKYRDVPAAWREPLLEQLKRVRDEYTLPVIAIDYVPPTERGRARETAERIKALGFIPWVANPDLNMIGVGAVEVIPRKILMLYGSERGERALELEYVARYAAGPLNWLGYVPTYREVSSGSLPNHPLAGRYAGIVTWFYGELGPNAKPVAALLQRAIREGVRVAVIGSFGFAPGKELNEALPVKSRAYPASQPAVRFERREGLGFELEPFADRRTFFPLTASGAEVAVQLANNRGDTMDAVAYAPWGGYAIDPYAIIELPNERGARWTLQPFEFFRRALALPQIPMPDVTTENGRRLMLVHIDGDGFASRAEFVPDWAAPIAKLVELPGAPKKTPPGHAALQGGIFAAEVLLRDVLERYRIPTTMSVIQGEVGPSGLYRDLSPVLEDIARSMFKLPHVEIASHSYSHPFRWQRAATSDGAPAALPLKDYRFDLATEVDGSVRYIEERLAPPGKKVRLFQWTGDCNPDADALARVYQAGIGNMNGGDTWITRAEPSVTLVAPLGVPRGELFQVFAPNQNENIYTNSFRGPFFGYQRVIETFELTDTPRRLKPINIYFHTFSASKRASLSAVQRVYDWALAQQPHPVHASEYFAKVLDFNRMVIAQAAGGLLIRGAGDLRALRMPVAAGYPDLAKSRGVAGYADHQGERYLHLAGHEALVALTRTAPRTAHLTYANARIGAFERKADSTTVTLKGHVPVAFQLANAARCQVRAGNTLIEPSAGTPQGAFFNLERNGATDTTIVCRD